MTTVADVMRRDVLTVPPDMSVRELIRFLSDEGISGTPVMEPGGAVVGVVSATDVLRLEADDAGVVMSPGPAPGHSGADDDDEDSEWSEFFATTRLPFPEGELEHLSDSLLDATTVADIMTPAVFHVQAGASLRELAEFLIRGRIHRALVVDGGRLEGLVTSFDVLQAVASGSLAPDKAGGDAGGHDPVVALG